MRIEAIATKINKKDATKYIISKIPLVSKVAPFNNPIGNVHLEYIEFKVLKYEIISKKKSKKLFRKETNKYVITMLVNTHNGHSESVDKIPLTSRKYVTKSCIKRAKVNEDDLIRGVKDEILYFLNEKSTRDDFERMSIQNIIATEIKSIYKPYWVADFRGRSILIEA